MKKFRENFLHVATVMGYMWAGWSCAVDEKWYYIAILIILTAITHMSAIAMSIENHKEDK